MLDSINKILVLGGTGLIGEEVVRRLAELNYSIVIVSLGAEVDREAFRKLKKIYPKIEHLTGNIFLPTEFKDKTFNELLESEEFLDNYLNLLYRERDPKQFFLHEIITQTKPDIIIDAINSATVLSYTRNTSFLENFLRGDILRQKSFLATLSMPRLLAFFDCLYKSLLDTSSVKTYLKIGTTGTGGMGFNIPYTHGETKPSYPLLEKAAIAGAYTSLLYVLSQTFGLPQIKEVKPAALVGFKKVAFDRVLLNRNSSQALKVYEFKNIRRFDLNGLESLNFENLRSTGPKEDFKAVFVDTGENGQFSLEEFRAISNEKQMGFVTKEEIADIVLKELKNQISGKDIIKSLKNSVVGPTKKAQEMRKKILLQMEQLEKKKSPSLAFEVLGPPRLAKLIFEAYLIKKMLKSPSEATFDEKNLNEEDISLILSIGIPILLNDSTLLVGRKPKIPDSEAEVTEESINLWAESGWVDLRYRNIKKWQERIESYKSVNKDPEIGDLVAWIFEKEDSGFRKTS